MGWNEEPYVGKMADKYRGLYLAIIMGSDGGTYEAIMTGDY
jgi:hypothetical protein